MTNLAVFDIGGTAVKCGLWENDQLSYQSKFITSKTLDDLVINMKKVINHYPVDIEGIAISAPGAVNASTRKIEGISAVKYLHNCSIFDIFEKAFRLPVRIENDANCAGIAEMSLGVGKDIENALFVVLGTGVGGAVFINGSLYKGSHLFGGEFGLMKNHTNQILSETGTIVRVAEAYYKKTGEKVDGKQLFELAKKKDSLVLALLDTMYENIAQILYDLQVALDPEMIIIGGGISERKEVIDELEKRLYHNLASVHLPNIMPQIAACQFRNDANLIGAATNYLNTI
ncbi:ROK family protein [Vagococcus luciliae]|uniref:Beta-glucoside kinase n=1 Tax=Vagococcus luciliae TaxID=2920380 RepID=A0ABY5NZM1_9ENTE|nr:ROK family protein [Vagococcus luciliae]UUV98977.1 Beta-glucoside kinase [Vagococcus luciliae]